MDRTPIRTDRIRKIIRGEGFAFIPHRFLYDGFMATLSSHELLVYFFLTLVADRQGISFYHYDRICTMLSLTLDEYIKARNGLITKNLIAFDGSRFQVLSLPPKNNHSSAHTKNRFDVQELLRPLYERSAHAKSAS